MKTISFRIALQRAEEKKDVTESRLLIAAKAGNKAAQSYLRSQYTTSQENDQLNGTPYNYDEDGPCAGFGCDAIIIY